MHCVSKCPTMVLAAPIAQNESGKNIFFVGKHHLPEKMRQNFMLLSSRGASTCGINVETLHSLDHSVLFQCYHFLQAVCQESETKNGTALCWVFKQPITKVSLLHSGWLFKKPSSESKKYPETNILLKQNSAVVFL